MAASIDVDSGLLPLANFAFQSGITLVKTVQRFRNHPRHVRELTEELEALIGVLGSLTETVGTTTDVDLSTLNLPLLQCGKACKEFEQEIMRCSSQSGDSHASFRDWDKLRYMNDDMDGFTRLVAGYKSTIIIALTDANLCHSSVTSESIDAYRALIKNATDDLEARLRSIDEKLETIIEHTVTGSNLDATEMLLIKEERISTQSCLQICAKLSDHIDQIQLTDERSSSSPERTGPDTVPERLTSNTLQECKNNLTLTAAKLERHMEFLFDRLMTKSSAATSSEEDRVDLAMLRDQWETARQCRDICAKADIHLKENTSIIDNYAIGDAVQFMVSTDGKPLHGSNRGLGWRTRQFGGYVSDVTLQKISRDYAINGFHNFGRENPSGNTLSVSDDETETKPGSEFKERYGRGFKLRK